MAKAKKQKGDEQKPDGSGGASATVLHQKLCLSIDMDSQQIYGYTELKILLAENENLALHAADMTIRNVLVDGEPAEFKYSLHSKNIGDQQSWCSVSCSKTAADAACSTYVSSLNSETLPNLIISCERPVMVINEQQHEGNAAKEIQNSSDEQIVNGCNGSMEEKVQNIKLVHIDYILEGAKTGIHFMDNVLHSNNQIRRAHCWFPCIDSAMQRCFFDLEFTVGSNLVAVSNGDLLYQVLSKENPPRKTYVYKLSTPVSAQWISLVVGPFEILPDSHVSSVSHMCLSPALSKLQNTVGFFHNAYSYYEDFLSISFPFGSYKQIFLPSEITISSTSLGASTCIFSSDVLYDEKVIDETIRTRVKLAYALARQWFGIYTSAEEPNDEWLLEGLAGFLADNFIKRFLGNNEAHYRRFKANCTVCRVDVCGATALSSSAASSDLYGTQSIGSYGKIRSWKAVAVLQMLEKQMGPDSFRKILQMIVAPTRASRTLSTKEFRHLANKVGNLERPFLKEFFPRWVESCGCPVMRTAVSYSKRRNMIELAVSRGCTAKGDPSFDGHRDGDIREGDAGWPGMMSIRVHELDGVYDHPVLPMAGEALQVVEIQCHSKLGAKRTWKSKKGSKPDGSDDNADTPAQDIRLSMDSPFLWISVDPEMEYLAEIHFHQPVQMWMNQLEKDKDVIAQSQAIAVLEKLPHLSFSVINALNNFLNDTKAFWRVRVEAAYALAVTASEETDLAGLRHLVKFYESCRFDADIGLPRPNDFHNVPEYFVLEATGELEFGKQIGLLPRLLKRIDHLLQFDSFMPSYNGVLTINCIRTLSRIATRLSFSHCLDRICELIYQFRKMDKPWKVRIEASRELLNLEFHFKGLDAAISLFLKYLEEEKTLRGETKLAVHALNLCQENIEPNLDNQISCPTLIGLLRLLASTKAYNNVFLRHHLFCILQVTAGRSPTLYGVPKVLVPPVMAPEICSDQQTKADSSMPQISRPQEPSTSTPSLRDVLPIAAPARDADNISACSERKNVLKIRVRHTTSSSKVGDADHQRDHSQGGRNENEMGPCSSMSVDAPAIGANEPLNISNHNIEELNSYDRESRMSASINTAKLGNKHEICKELQCTADSRVDALTKDQLSPANDVQEAVEKSDHLQGISASCNANQAQESMNGREAKEKREKDKKEKEKKRKRDEKRDKKDDPEYLEKKRLKKEKKRMEKEMAKEHKGAGGAASSGLRSPVKHVDSGGTLLTGGSAPVRNVEPQVSNKETTEDTAQTSVAPKIRIKIKTRNISNI